MYEEKIAEMMNLLDELQQISGRDTSTARERFMDSWSRYDPSRNKFVNHQMAVKWLDDETGQMRRVVESRRNRNR